MRDQMNRSFFGVFVCVVLGIASLPAAEALLTSTPTPEPPFDYAIDNGLYATITIPSSFEKPVITNEKKAKLKIDGFSKELEVRILWRKEQNAPLVVLLPGLSARAKDDLTQIWKSYLYDAGFHVLSFDSVFHPDFCKRTVHGASGYLTAEAEVVGKIVETFQKLPEAQGRISKIGLVGTSYGGTVALNCMRLAKQGKLPFTPDRVMALSPPVSLKTAAAFLDNCYCVDLPKFGLMDLLPLRGAEPTPGRPCPFSDSMMRAGIGYVFHSDLKNIVSGNLKLYSKDMNDFTVKDSGKYQFQEYEELFAQKYWEKKTSSGPVDLWAQGELSTLLRDQPTNVRVIIAADDPLNNPDQLLVLSGMISKQVLTVVPRGGHLGYVGSQWTKYQLAKLFE